MLLALEEGYDRPSWWQAGEARAEESGQEVQPLLMLKDTEPDCKCEGAPQVRPGWGQLDTYGDEIGEYVFCPFDSSTYRSDWRVGRELTDEQSRYWAMNSIYTDAHSLFNGKDTTTGDRISVQEADRVDGVDISSWVDVVDGLDISSWVTGFELWQRDFIDRLNAGRWQRGLIDGLYVERLNAPDQYTVTMDTYDFQSDLTRLTVTCRTADLGAVSVFRPLDPGLLEDDMARESAIRTTLEQCRGIVEQRRADRSTGGGVPGAGAASESGRV